MAANGGVRSCHGTLVAATADTITLSAAGVGDDVAITHHGNAVTAPLFVRTDGTAAVGAADETFVVRSGSTRYFKMGNKTISIICSGTAGYSVELI